jgi:hypothetical protein
LERKNFFEESETTFSAMPLVLILSDFLKISFDGGCGDPMIKFFDDSSISRLTRGLVLTRAKRADIEEVGEGAGDLHELPVGDFPFTKHELFTFFDLIQINKGDEVIECYFDDFMVDGVGCP